MIRKKPELLCPAGDWERLKLAAEALILEQKSVREIALSCGFEDENLLAKFFKYHEKITPSMYRNRYFHIHMNDH